jgi:hypothetical protein
VTPSNAATQINIANFDPAKYLQRGADLTNPDYTPEGAARRVGKPLSQIVVGRDYDYARITAIEGRLIGVDRATVLTAIFNKLTAGATTNQAKHLAVLRFLQQASIHNPKLLPMYADGTMVQDPLVLLELGEMQCGQVSRVAVDLFAAGGYQARLVQLGGHVIAEVYYDADWHYFDADVFGGGTTVFNSDGSIPSVVELSRNPYLIDSLPAFWEPSSGNGVVVSQYDYPSYYYFSRAAWQNNFAGRAAPVPYVMYKTATPLQASNSRLYGWEYLSNIATPERQLYDMPLYKAPGVPTISSVSSQRLSDGTLQVTITWTAPPDADGDVQGYRVLVSRQSRGWNYDGVNLPQDVAALESSTSPWNSSMYAARFTMPKSEVFSGVTRATTQVLRLTGTGDYFVSVMPYDAHGQSFGRTLYPSSEELRISTQTWGYIADFDPSRYAQRGTDPNNPDYTPEAIARRVGRPLDQIVIGRDYDFARLDRAVARVAGIDRAFALKEIFDKITAGARTNRDKHVAVLRFLQQSMVRNPYLLPVYRDGSTVWDPLVLLELGETMQGGMARLAVDLFDSVGYQARLVQLGQHVIAEIYYDQKWHYFDAALFNNGDTLFNPDGAIPSVVELSRNPYWIDSLTSNPALMPGGGTGAPSGVKASYLYFSRQAWVSQFPPGSAPSTPYVRYKTASASLQKQSRFYGWEYTSVASTPSRLMYDM